MSIRYGWMSDPDVEFVPAGTQVGEHQTDTDALIIWGDEATVIEGDLVAFAQRVTQALAGSTETETP